MQPQPNQKKSGSVKEIIDNAKAIAFKRGSEEPDWNDIWLGMIKVRDFEKVLVDRGVDTYGLRSDLQYMSRYGVSRDGLVEDTENLSLMEQVQADLIQDLEEFKTTFLRAPSDEDSEEFDDFRRRHHDRMVSAEVGEKLDTLIDFAKAKVENVSNQLHADAQYRDCLLYTSDAADE